MSTLLDNTPIIIGAGQITEKPEDLATASRPLDLMEQTARAAMQDAGLNEEHFQQLDELIIVRSFVEPTKNSAYSLAQRLAANNATQKMITHGGNHPQYLVNRYSEAIAQGQCNLVLISGAEAMHTHKKSRQAGTKPNWYEDAPTKAEYLFEDELKLTFMSANLIAGQIIVINSHSGCVLTLFGCN